ncbi:hypothetical protein P154DRAFT_528295 [Amniculicola lignicola CBS 123094]|uniref:Uncharacterized protein n=1 Tax=Amniculicola lignicola CBS 123094 TaxID=1392246 RepID=A0A6A5VUK3_9PLEO|nr:hypothetical protein P154DRAFT_528295 [Amniculicola lignicola CBS 123094]
MALGASKISKYYIDVALLKDHAAQLSDKKPSNYRLSPEQDLALERYLDAIDAIGYGIHRSIELYNVFIPNTNNCKLVTLVEYISANGASITPIRCSLAPFKLDTILSQLKWQEDCSDDERKYSPILLLAAVKRTITLEIPSSPPLAALLLTLMPIASFHRVKINLVVLHKHLPYKVAASVIKHQRRVSALAYTVEGLKRELCCTEAAKIAKDKHHHYKRRTLDVKGSLIYSQDARHISELTAQKLRKITTITNKYKRVLPSIYNYSRKYCKRAVHAKDNKAYNTKAISHLNYLERPYTSQLHDTTNNCTYTVQVAREAQRLIDPYLKLVAQLEQQRKEQAQLQADPQTQSLYIKAENESQELPTQEPVEMEDEMDKMSHKDSNLESLTAAEYLQND